MKHFLLAALSLIFLSSARAQEPASYADYMAQARDAFAAEDWSALSESLDAAQLHRPYSLYVMRNRILARELKGDRPGALSLLQALAERGLSTELAGHPAFDALKEDPAYAPIAARMASNIEPIGKSEIVVTAPDDKLLPEAINKDSEGNIWIGSVRNGCIRSLGAGDEAYCKGNGGVFDIEFHDGLLWAAVNNQLAYEKSGEAPAYGSLVAFDPESGAVRREHQLGADALIGDIEVASDGTLYASDSITPRIFKLAPEDEQATAYANPRYVNLQGIALDEANNRMFIADYLTGLYVMDLASGESTLIRNEADAHLGGIDGLYYVNGKLVGIQNGTTPQRIVSIKLSKDGLSARKLKVLAQALPEWNEPTHGFVDGKHFLYIATSNWPSYDESKDWALREGAELQPLRIMSVKIR